jgi:hypothetical protein
MIKIQSEMSAGVGRFLSIGSLKKHCGLDFYRSLGLCHKISFRKTKRASQVAQKKKHV